MSKFVHKLGGSIMGNPQLLKNIITQIPKYKNSVFVVSAVNTSIDKSIGTTSLLTRLYETNNLFEKKEICNKIICIHEKLSDKLEINIDNLQYNFNKILKISQQHTYTKDHVLSIGESLASDIMCDFLIKNGFNSISVKYSEKYHIDNLHIYENRKNLINSFKNHNLLLIQNYHNNSIIPVYSGFLETINENMINTMGRGYTDTTGAIIANSISASKYIIWKETGGVFSGHPHKINNVQLIKNLSIDEAIQLTTFGNETLHQLTSEFAKDNMLNISINDVIIDRKYNTDIYYNIGTYEQDIIDKKIYIDNESLSFESFIHQKSIKDKKFKAICSKKDLDIIHVNISGELQKKFINNFIDIGTIILTTNNAGTSILVDNIMKRKILELEIMKKNRDHFKIKSNKSIICCIGDSMKGYIGIAGEIMKTLSNQNINIEMIYQESTENNIMIVVSSLDEINAIESLHKKFIL